MTKHLLEYLYQYFLNYALCIQKYVNTYLKLFYSLEEVFQVYLIDIFQLVMLNDFQYLDAVKISTGDKKRVIRRFEMAESILGEI